MEIEEVAGKDPRLILKSCSYRPSAEPFSAQVGLRDGHSGCERRRGGRGDDGASRKPTMRSMDRSPRSSFHPDKDGKVYRLTLERVVVSDFRVSSRTPSRPWVSDKGLISASDPSIAS